MHHCLVCSSSRTHYCNGSCLCAWLGMDGGERGCGVGMDRSLGLKWSCVKAGGHVDEFSGGWNLLLGVHYSLAPGMVIWIHDALIASVECYNVRLYPSLSLSRIRVAAEVDQRNKYLSPPVVV